MSFKDTSVDHSTHPLLSELQANDAYDQFFQDGFDASRFANNIIQGSTISDSLMQLSDGIQRLDAELRSQVSAHHDDLLRQATGVQHLEDVLKMVSTRVAALAGSIDRIQDKVNKPYTKIVARTSQLMRLQSACELLRRTLRYSYLAKRLRTQLQGGNREIGKAANTLMEIRSLKEVTDLSGIEIVDAEESWMADAETQIYESAVRLLSLGMDSQQQMQLGTALQVFRNLGQLKDRVDEVVQDKMQTAVSATKALFTDPDFSERRLLERVLSKKRDHASQFTYLAELGQASAMGVSNVEHFWTSMMIQVGNEFANLHSVSPFIERAFQSEFPKLLRLMTELSTRVMQQSNPEGSGTFAGSSRREHTRACEDAILVFEQAYLSHSLNRMFDPVQLVFPPGGRTPPSVDEVANICTTLSKELHVTSGDQRLSQLVTKNVAKTVRLYLVKTEEMFDSTAEFKIERGHETSAAHLRNMSLANRLDQLCKGLKQINSSQLGTTLSAAANDTIAGVAKECMDMLDTTLLAPIFWASTVHFERLIRQMHYESFASDVVVVNEDADNQDAACSRYLQQLVADVAHFQAGILVRLTCKDAATAQCNELIKRVLELFVRHVCMIRSVGTGGRARLAADIARLQTAFAPLGCNADDLSATYDSVKALSTLLTMEISAMVPDNDIIALMPRSLVLLHLFSRAPEDLQTPNTAQGWTLEEARGDKQFHPVYPVMTALAARR